MEFDVVGSSRWRQSSRLTLAALAITGAACAGDAPPAAGPASTVSVDALIGDAHCDSDVQCRTIGVGAKACGGPQRYVAWSTLLTDGVALQGAVASAALADRLRAEKSGVLSNCAVVVDPGAQCVASDARAAASPPTAGVPPPARQCRIRTSGSAGAARIY